MAFLSDDPNDPSNQNQNQNQQQQNQNAGQNPTLSGGGGGVFSSTSGAPAPAAGGSQDGTTDAPKATSSGLWTNLQSYLDANQDQGAQLGQGLAGKIDQEAQGAKDSINQANTDFGNQVNSSGASLDKEKDFIDQATANPTGADQDAVSRFLGDSSATYNGPKDMTGTSSYMDTLGKVNKASTDLSQTGTESGRFGLLKDQYGRPDYTQGQQSLDQLLLEGNPQSQQAFNDLGSKWTGLSDQLSGAVNQSQQTAAQRAADTQAVGQYAHNTVNQAVDSRKQAIDAAVAQANAARQAQYATAASDLGKNALTPEELQAFGLTAGTDTYGLKPASYLDQSAVGNLDRNMVASQQDQADLAALSKLSGSPELASYINPTAMPGSPLSFQTNKFNSDLAAAKGTYQNALNGLPAESGINGWTPAMIAQQIDQASKAGTTSFFGGSMGPAAANYIKAINQIRSNYGLGQAKQDKYGGWSWDPTNQTIQAAPAPATTPTPEEPT